MGKTISDYLKKRVELKTGWRIMLSILIPVLFLIPVYYLCDVRFQSNDDRFIAEILSGHMAGTWTWQIAYVSPLFTIPIMALYGLFPRLPIWGLVLLVLLLLSFSVILFILIDGAETVGDLLLSFAVAGFILLAGLHLFSNVQYTSIGIILGFAGYAAACAFMEEKRGMILFFLLEFLSFGIRELSMESVQPIGFAFLTCLIIVKYRKDMKKGFNRVLIYVILIASIMGIHKGAGFLLQNGNSWGEYQIQEKTRGMLTDYGRDIEYADLKDILDRYDVSEEEYHAFYLNRYYQYDSEFSPDCMRELGRRMKEIQKERKSFRISAADVWEKLFADHSYSHLNKILLLGIVVSAVALILSNKKMEILPLAGITAGYLFDILYLCYKGRFTRPVMMPLYMGVLTLLVIYVLSMVKDMKSVRVILAVLFLAAGLFSGRNQYWEVKAQNRSSETMLNNLYAFKEYCAANPDKKFVLDMQNVGWGIYGVLDTDYVLDDNMMYTGSWYMQAPGMIERYKEFYGGDEFYYMIYEEFDGFNPAEGIDFYTKETGAEPVLYASFPVPIGVNCNVWRFSSRGEESE